VRRAISVVAILLGTGATAGTSQVSANAELGYRLTVPDGFTAFPAGRSQPDVVGCWSEVAPASPSGALLFCVQRLGGTLPRDSLRQGDLPPATQLVRFQWKGFEIDGLKTDTAQAGASVVVLVAQVPLRREAIQLIVSGPRDQTARAQAIMTSTLASLEGETNWLTGSDRAGRLGTIVGWVGGIALGFIVVRIWRSRQRARSS
jgi:hypothetical protein